MFKAYTLFTLLFFVSVTVKAQDSVIPEISYPYLDKLITSAKIHYPKLTGYNDKINLARINVKRAGISWFDILTFSYIYQPNNTLNYAIPTTNTGTTVNRFLFNGLQLGVSLNLGSILTKPYTIKAAQEDLNIVRDEQNEFLVTLTADVKRRYFTYLLQKNLVKLQTQSYQDMQTLLKQTKYKFQKGEATFDVYNAALITASARAEQKLQAETNFLIAKSELEALVGLKLEDIE
ncbi:MAG: TolC family protein [Mucilaginibacter sp.]|uniref:TolC family protein n=1 Tax=Mucilaginibacter sp. TaxID=1882438 RepID=UPI0034E39682